MLKGKRRGFCWAALTVSFFSMFIPSPEVNTHTKEHICDYLLGEKQNASICTHCQSSKTQNRRRNRSPVTLALAPVDSLAKAAPGALPTVVKVKVSYPCQGLCLAPRSHSTGRGQEPPHVRKERASKFLGLTGGLPAPRPQVSGSQHEEGSELPPAPPTPWETAALEGPHTHAPPAAGLLQSRRTRTVPARSVALKSNSETAHRSAPSRRGRVTSVGSRPEEHGP